MIRIPPDADLANVIDTLLRLTGTTQAQLARTTGIDQPSISRWRHGYTIPNATNLAKLVAGVGWQLAVVPREDA